VVVGAGVKVECDIMFFLEKNFYFTDTRSVSVLSVNYFCLVVWGLSGNILHAIDNLGVEKIGKNN
jgi:hypothetical protein